MFQNSHNTSTKNTSKFLGITSPRPRSHRRRRANALLTVEPMEARTLLSITPPADLVAWWPGDGNAADIIGGNSGTLVGGASYTPGKVAQSFNFNGVDGFVQAPDSDLWAFGTHDFSINMWVNFNAIRPSSVGEPAVVFIGNDEGPGNTNKWTFALGGGELYFLNGNTTQGYDFLTVPWAPNPGQWYNLGVTRSGTTFTYYVDGMSIGTRTSAFAVPNANAPLTIGQSESAVGHTEQFFMDGRIDEVQIYNRALSGPEVASIASAGSDGLTKGPMPVSPLVVTNTNDDGPGSLREAILDANGSPGADEIDFNIPGTGVHTIQPQTPLPGVGDAVVIDGYTQPGASRNTAATGTNAVLQVEINGNALDPANSGPVLEIDAPNSTVRGLVVNGGTSDSFFGRALIGLYGGHDVVEGCFVGTDATGTQPLGPGIGVDAFAGGAHDNRIGVDGKSPDALGQRNLISGNAKIGIWLGPGNTVAGNLIGTDRTGALALPNGTDTSFGFRAAISAGGLGNVIGTNSDGQGDDLERNVISGNAFIGITVSGGSNNVIAGNFIGTDASGTQALANFVGVQLDANYNRIGTNGDGVNDAAERNVISGNTDANVSIQGLSNVVAGNFIGTDATGSHSLDLPGINGVFLTNGSAGNRIGVSGGGADPVAERNVIVGGHGVRITDSGGNVVAGNYIGTDSTGMHTLSSGDAIDLEDATGNTIGTNADGVGDAAERNVIASNNSGIGLYGSSDNVIAGNYIGLAADGTTYLGGGVHLAQGSRSNRVGTNGDGRFDDAERNVVDTGGGEIAVSLVDPGTTGNVVAGNFIGTDATGTRVIPNDSYVPRVLIADAPGNTIGGLVGNVITGSGVSAVVVTGSTATGNSIRGNSIFANNGLGIDLGQDGVTANDSHAGQPGPNNWQNFPVLSPALGGPSTQVPGTLQSTPNTSFAIDFYANAATDPTGYGQGQRWLGWATVTTDASGSATFDVSNLAASVPGEWISATATGPSGTSEFAQDVKVIPPASLSGIVFSDFNNDGQVDFGEQGIPGVPITLTGTNDLGHAVNLSQTTDSAGAYVFPNLRPGAYTITETQQPAGYTQGINSVGTGGGTVTLDQFDLNLAAGLNALNYNYGERPAATGAVHSGQTAGIGFWNNKNGQALIKALNGGAGHQLGDWLAATFPHMFGASAGSDNQAGKSNTAIAAFFQTQFVVKDQKLDAQVLATALAVYVTDATLDSTGVGTQYGFLVSGNGVATATYNVGSNGAAFGVADNTVMTVMDLLLAADSQAVNGVLYNGNTVKRNKANTVFSAINQAGGI
jgi:hypothetical protein